MKRKVEIKSRRDFEESDRKWLVLKSNKTEATEIKQYVKLNFINLWED